MALGVAPAVSPYRQMPAVLQRPIVNRLVWALVLTGIAAGLYSIEADAPSTRGAPFPDSPNVRSLKSSSSGWCTIKGNVSTTGERIYHVPGQTYYAATVINPRKGERWFCFEWQARLAGWRKAKL